MNSDQPILICSIMDIMPGNKEDLLSMALSKSESIERKVAMLSFKLIAGK